MEEDLGTPYELDDPARADAEDVPASAVRTEVPPDAESQSDLVGEEGGADDAELEAADEAVQEESMIVAVEEAIEETVEEATEELIVEGVDPEVAEAVAEEAVAEALEEAVVEAVVTEVLEEAVVEAVVEAVLEEAVEEAAPPEPAAVAEPAAVEEPATVPEPKPATAPKPDAPDPFRGPGDWYVVHTYAGYENKVKTNLASRIQSMQMQDKIFDVEIPMEDVMEIKGGKKQVVKKKVFPGYLLVKMIYDNDSWYVVRNTPGVTGFVSSGTGSKPTPLSRREIEKILVVKEEAPKPQYRLEFEEGDVVRIISGPFADFNGTINEINVDQSKLKVLVNIFDRETPVELGFDQVAKV